MISISTWLPLLALAIVLPGLVVVLQRQNKFAQRLTQLEELSEKLLLVERALAQTVSDRELLEESIDELRAEALSGMQRMNQLEQALIELAQSQPNPEELEPERRLYRRAMRMVELGADLDEIIQECELPRAEAELLLSLHKQ